MYQSGKFENHQGFSANSAGDFVHGNDDVDVNTGVEIKNKIRTETVTCLNICYREWGERLCNRKWFHRNNFLKLPTRSADFIVGCADWTGSVSVLLASITLFYWPPLRCLRTIDIQSFDSKRHFPQIVVSPRHTHALNRWRSVFIL